MRSIEQTSLTFYMFYKVLKHSLHSLTRRIIVFYNRQQRPLQVPYGDLSSVYSVPTTNLFAIPLTLAHYSEYYQNSHLSEWRSRDLETSSHKYKCREAEYQQGDSDIYSDLRIKPGNDADNDEGSSNLPILFSTTHRSLYGNYIQLITHCYCWQPCWKRHRFERGLISKVREPSPEYSLFKAYRHAGGFLDFVSLGVIEFSQFQRRSINAFRQSRRKLLEGDWER